MNEEGGRRSCGFQEINLSPTPHSLSSPTWVFQNWEAFWQGLSLALEDAGPWEGGSDEDPSRAGEESTGLQGQQRGGVQGV
jgi:hypothetical protein